MFRRSGNLTEICHWVSIDSLLLFITVLSDASAPIETPRSAQYVNFNIALAHIVMIMEIYLNNYLKISVI